MTAQVTFPPEVPLLADGSKVGGWWHVDERRNRVVCDLCPRHCALKDGDRGFCFVRQNQGGKIVLTTYGRSTGFCIDPIEKKPLNQFFPGTAVLSFGTGGCNLGCKFCQNWTTTKSRETDTWCEEASPEAIAAAAKAHGCTSVAFTYNEPIIWAEYAIDTALACHRLGIKTVAVTNGYIDPLARKAFFEVMDAANVDLKAFTEEFYRKYCLGHLQPVLDTLKWLVHESSVWVEITNLLIPQANDSPEEIRAMCRWIRDELRPDVPIHFTAFHPDFQMLDRPPTPPSTLKMAYQIAREEGLLYVYTGNILDVRTQTTYCPRCGKAVIERQGYYISGYWLRGNRCAHCGFEIAGHYAETAGTWGSRRVPIKIPPLPRSASSPPRASGPTSNPHSHGNPSEQPKDPRPDPSQEGSPCDSGPQTEGKIESRANTPNPSEDTAARNPSEETGVRREKGAAIEGCAPPASSEVPASPRVIAQAPPAGSSSAPDSSWPTNPPAIVPHRPNLTPQEEAKILRCAADRVVAAICGGMLPTSAEALGPAASKPVYGVFVSLKRHGQLRSCCGALGQPIALATALDQAAYRAAREDLRFPPISPSELRYLDIEVWILWNFQPLPGRGPERAKHVRIGTHGLEVARGTARGLLLPGVAVEHGLDAESFLEHTCLKAGLPPDAWKAEDVQIFTFEGYALHGKLAELLPQLPDERTLPGPTSRDLENLITLTRNNLWALLIGGTPTFFQPGVFDGQVCGVAIWLNFPGWKEPLREARINLRPDVPLQSTLYELTNSLARSLQSRQFSPSQFGQLALDIAIFWDVIPHGNLSKPDWSGFEPSTRCLMVVSEGGWSLGWNREQTVEGLLQEVVKPLQIRRPEQAGLYSFRILSSCGSGGLFRTPVRQVHVTVRAPAVSGRFYPADGEAIAAQLARWSDSPLKPEKWAGALVPHAGWIYSGKLAFETLRRVEIPERVLVFATKHRPEGASWAVAPYERWQLPDGHVLGDPSLSHQLAAAVEGLELDGAAHAREHAIEVLLPMLQYLRPDVRVVGIVMRGGEFEELDRFGQQFATFLRSLPSLPLIVISTDMSHYIPEEDARRLDKLALEAMEQCNPRELYEVVRQKQISMCGLIPTVAALMTLQHLGLLNECYRVAYTTSAEVSGDRRAVVGYAGLLFR